MHTPTETEYVTMTLTEVDGQVNVNDMRDARNAHLASSVQAWLCFILQIGPITQKYEDTCQPIRKEYFSSPGYELTYEM